MSFFRRLFPAQAYISYWLNAIDEQSLHSPFLYKFYTEVIKSNKRLPAFDAIESRRNELLSNSSIINLQDPGAGSLVSASQQRTIGSIAKHSLSPKPFCTLLYRLVQFQQPTQILEIGTSLGISTAYIATTVPAASITTIEGSPAIASVAKETFSQLQIQNIQLLEGKAQALLPVFSEQTTKLDLVFIDAHHNEAATLLFFDTLINCLHHQSIVVVGDIHWSADMESAWNKLILYPEVTLSVDIFDAGILFFNPDLRKETEVLWN